MIILITLAVLVACIIILGLLIALKCISNRKITNFQTNFSKIYPSMPKKDVVAIMGTNYNSNLIDNKEVLIWKLEKTSSIERELLSKKESALVATVVFENNAAIEYHMSSAVEYHIS